MQPESHSRWQDQWKRSRCDLEADKWYHLNDDVTLSLSKWEIAGTSFHYHHQHLVTIINQRTKVCLCGACPRERKWPLARREQRAIYAVVHPQFKCVHFDLISCELKSSLDIWNLFAILFHGQNEIETCRQNNRWINHSHTHTGDHNAASLQLHKWVHGREHAILILTTLSCTFAEVISPVYANKLIRLLDPNQFSQHKIHIH